MMELEVFPLDVELYQKADNLPDGKDDPKFQKKPELAFNLIEKCLDRNYIPKVILMDGGYGNNSTLLGKIEEKNLKYIGVIAKNRNVLLVEENKLYSEKRIEQIASELSSDNFEKNKNRQK